VASLTNKEIAEKLLMSWDGRSDLYRTSFGSSGGMTSDNRDRF